MSRPSLLLLLLVGLPGCDTSPTGSPFVNDQGMDPRGLASAYEMAREIPGSLSLLVQRHGQLVAEEYFHGFAPDSLHDVRSVTKSVVSILLGLAIEDGLISSVDAPVGPYLTPVVDSIRPELAETSIRHFLMMSSGLEWHELGGGSSYGEWWQSEDMIQHVVDLPFVHEPGERFLYNTGASHLLSVILTEATEMPTLDFARLRLFGPLGFSDSSWLQENRGYYTGGMGLRITARDMLTLGQMFLDGGRHEGVPIVPSDWVTESTARHLSTDGVMPFCTGYGYLWWVCEGSGQNFYLANGFGGQFILVAPQLDLVVVAQSHWRGMSWDDAGAQWYQVLSLIVEEILPAAR